MTDSLGTAIDAPVTWTSTNTSVATVSNGLVTARAPGSAYVVAQSGALRDSAQFIVSQISMFLIVDASPAVIAPGGTSSLRARLADANGYAMSDAAGATFTSSVPLVATVSGSVATGVDVGATRIDARAGGLAGSTLLRVQSSGPANTVTGCLFRDHTISVVVPGARITATGGATAVTGADGYFTLHGVPDHAALDISAPGFYSTRYHDVRITGATTHIGCMPLVQNTFTNATFVVTVATWDRLLGRLAVPGATIAVRAGANDTTGPIVAQAVSGAGETRVDVPPGTYTVSVSKPGYTTRVTTQGADYARELPIGLMPSITSSMLRVEVAWDMGDLDVWFAGAYWFDPSVGPPGGPTLEWDVRWSGDREAAYAANPSGSYGLSVVNWGGGMATARVSVFRGTTLLARFTPPTGVTWRIGDRWTVFTFDGTTFTPLNLVSNGCPMFNKDQPAGEHRWVFC
jgi:hypothetical protein